MFHDIYGIDIAVRARAGVLTIADQFASSEAYASMLVVFANEDLDDVGSSDERAEAL